MGCWNGLLLHLCVDVFGGLLQSVRELRVVRA